MSTRREGEHRVTEQYREPFGSVRGGLGIGQAAPWFAICFIVILIGLILGGWMLVHWWETDAWSSHPLGVIAVNTSFISLISTFILWKMKVAYDKHIIYVRRAHSEIDIIDEQPYLLREGSDKGFNSEVEGDIVRVINPKSIAPAGNTTINNLGGQDGNGNDGNDDDTFTTPTLLAQLNNGTTTIDESTSIVGYVDGVPLRGSLFARSGNLFDSLLAIGDQGFGKSSLGVLIACYTILHGGKILVIDPDAEEPESLTIRLGALSRFLMGPVADTPEKTLHVVSIAREAIESPSGRPVLWLIDEFSYLMRQAENKDSKWNDAAKQIKELVEDYATRGRKRLCRVVAFGQIAKVERTGGSEFRDSCTLMAFHLKKDRAQQILEADAAEITSQLIRGEVVVVPRNAGGQAYKLSLPYADGQAVSRVIEMVGMAPDLELLNGQRTGNLSATHGTPANGSQTVTVRPVRPDVDYVESQFSACTDGFLNDTDDTVELPDLPEDLPELYMHNSLENDVIEEPVEPTHNGARYTLDTIKIEMFDVAYRITGNMDESLKHAGANSRYRAHARQIIAERDLKGGNR